jgi:hypothetical protein
VRIEEQWRRESRLYVEESEEAKLASLDKMEARVWQLRGASRSLRPLNKLGRVWLRC